MHKSGKCLALSGTEGLPPVPNKADDAHRDYQNMRKLRSNRRRPRREAAPVPTATPPSGRRANGGAGGSSPRGSSGATDGARATEFRRAKRGAFCVFCGLNSNAAALAGHSFTHFETITEKNIKKQPRHPKEITPIKSYQKYAYIAFPHAHVPYIIGEPPPEFSIAPPKMNCKQLS